MIVLSYPIWAGCALLAVWAGYRAVTDRAVILRQLIAGGVLEALLLAQAVVAVVAAIGGHALAEPATFWGYVVVALMMMPIAAVIAIVERTRWSSVAMILVLVTIAVMQLRMATLWEAVPA